MLRYLILGVLRDGRARHGYGIMKEYRDVSGAEISIGNFYREIQRLARDGLIQAVVNRGDVDRRRIPYETTPTGREVFDAWVSSPLAWGLTEHQDDVSLCAYLISRTAHVLGAKVTKQWREELGLRRQVAAHALEATSPRDGVVQAGRLTLRRLLLARRLERVCADVEFVGRFEAAYGALIEERTLLVDECEDGVARRKAARAARTKSTADGNASV